MESQSQNPELTLYLIEMPFNTFTNRAIGSAVAQW